MSKDNTMTDKQKVLREARDFYDTYSNQKTQFHVSIPDAVEHIGKLLEAYDDLELIEAENKALREQLKTANDLLETLYESGILADYEEETTEGETVGDYLLKDKS